MRIADAILIVILFLPGGYLLSKACIRLREESADKILVRGYTRKHVEWTRKLVDRGMIAFPGIHLASPAKCWLCAELAFLSILSVALLNSSTLKGVTLALPSAFLAATALLYLSLRSESSKILSVFNQDLPLAAFLMSLLIESGMGPSAAMKETVAALPQRACAGELGDILRGRELGVSRLELFEGSRKRVPIDDYRAFLNLIEQGERLGIGLSQGLNDLSRRILEAQSHRADMLAQQAAVKMLLPLVLFIFPAVFLIVLSPVILEACSMAGW